MTRADLCNNPTAFTTALAHEGGLILGTDYTQGPPFTTPTGPLFTAMLIGDPIALTIKVIDDVGFYTLAGAQRWEYSAVPRFVWESLPDLSLAGGMASKRDIIGFMYAREGGTTMRHLFPNYGRL